MPDEPLDLDAIEARARDWRDYRAGKELVLALIARVREQEQEIAALRQDDEWLDEHYERDFFIRAGPQHDRRGEWRLAVVPEDRRF